MKKPYYTLEENKKTVIEYDNEPLPEEIILNSLRTFNSSYKTEDLTQHVTVFKRNQNGRPTKIKEYEISYNDLYNKLQIKNCVTQLYVTLKGNRHQIHKPTWICEALNIIYRHHIDITDEQIQEEYKKLDEEIEKEDTQIEQNESIKS